MPNGQQHGPRWPLQGGGAGGYVDNGLRDRPSMGINNPALVWPGESGGSQSGPNTSQRGGPGIGSSGSRSGVNRPVGGGSTGASQSGVNQPVAGGSVGGTNSPNLAELGIGPGYDSYTRPEGATITEGHIGSGLFMAGEGATPRQQALAIAEGMIQFRGETIDAEEEWKDRTVTRSGSTARNGVETSSSGSTTHRGTMTSRVGTESGGVLTVAQQEAIQQATGYRLPRVDRHGNPIRYEFQFRVNSRLEQRGGAISRNGVSVGGRATASYEGSRGGVWMVRQGTDPNTGTPYNIREPLRTSSSHQLEAAITVGGRRLPLPQIPGLTHSFRTTVHHPDRLPDTSRPAPVSMPSRAQMIQHGTVVPEPSREYYLP